MIHLLTNWQWSWGIFAQGHIFKGPKSKGWSVASEAPIVFKVQETAMQAYYALKDWGKTTRWLFTMHDTPKNQQVLGEHGPEGLCL
jgi:hypothetical protein